MWHPPWGTCVTCKWDRLCQQQTARRCPPPQSITTKTEVIFTSITCHRHSAGEKMCNHPFSITLQKNHKPFSLSFFFSLNKEKQAQIQISNIVPVISLPQVYWRKTHPRGHWVLINSDEERDPSESFNRLWGSEMSEWSRLCISQVLLSPIKIPRQLTGNV